MGLALTRIGFALSRPTPRLAAGLALGTTLTAGTTLATQYAYGDDFSTRSGVPVPSNLVAGGAGVAGVSTAITGVIYALPGSYGRQAWAPGWTVAGAGLGIVAGTFLAAPLVRAVVADR